MAGLRISLLLFLLAGAWLVRSWAVGTSFGEEAHSQPPPTLRHDQITSMTDALVNWRGQGLERLFGDDGLKGLTPQDPALAGSQDAALWSAILRYAKAQHGLGEGIRFPQNWAIRAAPYDAEGELAAALQQDRLAQWLQSLPPPFKAYRDLLAVLEHYRQIRAAAGWEKLTGPLPLKEGMSGPAIRALRERLSREDYDVPSDSDAFDPALREAVAKYQQTHGLAPTGLVDWPTRASLNVPVDQRIAQIVANLERWRWLPRDLPETRVEVNIPAASADLFIAGEPVLSMRAVVGRPADKTPMLAAQIDAIILNPSWIVPPKIAAREILPKAQREPDYLAREGFTSESDPARPGQMRLRQLPGDRNALGRIKFDLPNPFNVYLHDTPVRKLFARDRRALSHGCIRVEKPLDLALGLLQGDAAWPAEKITQAIAEGVTRRINLARPVPVFLLYWTVFTDPDGIVNFRDDLYGWDKRLLHGHEIG